MTFTTAALRPIGASQRGRNGTTPTKVGFITGQPSQQVDVVAWVFYHQHSVLVQKVFLLKAPISPLSSIGCHFKSSCRNGTCAWSLRLVWGCNDSRLNSIHILHFIYACNPSLQVDQSIVGIHQPHSSWFQMFRILLRWNRRWPQF